MADSIPLFVDALCAAANGGGALGGECFTPPLPPRAQGESKEDVRHMRLGCEQPGAYFYSDLDLYIFGSETRTSSVFLPSDCSYFALYFLFITSSCAFCHAWNCGSWVSAIQSGVRRKSRGVAGSNES